jgi:4-amino-4-deoxy-L-arabinose transferase-like glycosyltransferase
MLESIWVSPEFRLNLYIRRVRTLVRKHPLFFVAVVAAGLLLRAFFLARFPQVVNDSFVYGDIAKNWLLHGTFGLSGPHGILPTCIRLPGYPAFLAFIFATVGLEHYRAVLVVQMFVDLGTCFLCASIALRLLGPRVAKLAFLLAAVCPFLANYSAAALTETLEIFFTALAFDLALKGLDSPRLLPWAGCGVSCTCAMLLRPDGGMLPFVVVIYLLWRLTLAKLPSARRFLFNAAVLVAVIPGLALIPWTWRNWRVFHQLQPLAPRYANQEGEFVPMGFNRWVKTWIVDYVSVEEVYWQVPGQPIDAAVLPSRAFDTPEQDTQTFQLIRDYNAVLHVTPQLDKRFETLATERIRSHPVRYYLWLPLLRITDMWLRPRTGMLPSDTRWWEFNDDPVWSALAVSLGVIGVLYVVCGIVGSLGCRDVGGGLLILFVVVRSGFLGSLENPEPRYTLEMYPIVIVFAAAALVARHKRKTERDQGGTEES